MENAQVSQTKATEEAEQADSPFRRKVSTAIPWWEAPSELTFPNKIFEAIGDYFGTLGIHGALRSVNEPLQAALSSEDPDARAAALEEIQATLLTVNFLGRLYELHKRSEFLSLRDGRSKG